MTLEEGTSSAGFDRREEYLTIEDIKRNNSLNRDLEMESGAPGGIHAKSVSRALSSAGVQLRGVQNEC